MKQKQFKSKEKITKVKVTGDHVTANLGAEKKKEVTKAGGIINSHHQRGSDELPHRGIKDFGCDELMIS